MTSSAYPHILQELADSVVPLAPDCQQCQDLLAAYIEAELSGADPAPDFPEVAAHMADCDACQEAYMETRELFTLEASGEMQGLPRQYDYDLGFLTTPNSQEAAPDLWQRVEAAGHTILRLATVLQVTIQERTARFTDLPPLLTPQPMAMPITRGSEQKGESIILPPTGSMLEWKLAIGPIVDGQGVIQINVINKESRQPVDRVQVTLRDPNGRTLSSVVTRKDGQVILERIDSGTYTVELIHGDERIESPMQFQ